MGALSVVQLRRHQQPHAGTAALGSTTCITTAAAWSASHSSCRSRAHSAHGRCITGSVRHTGLVPQPVGGR